MSRPRYSSKVSLRLVVGELVFALAQVGPSHAILAESTSLPPTDARIEIDIDNKTSTRDVFLYDGVRPESTRFEYYFPASAWA